jgi:hypothetical protein
MNATTPETVTAVTDLPLMMSAKDIQSMGFSRTIAYAILHQDDMPVVKVGKRLFLKRDEFFSSISNQSKGVTA